MPRSEKQLANDQRLRDLAAAKRAKTEQSEPFNPNPDVVDEVKNGISQDEASALLNRLKELEAKLATMGTPQSQETPRMSHQGNLIGEYEKYTVNPANYEDFSERLKKEQRLAPLAFEYNYELKYTFDISPYERKDGINVKEPRFKYELNRIQLDDEGNQTPGRYTVKTLFLHEDPQAALTIAHDNGIDLKSMPQIEFLNEMRYLRIRDWLLDVFYPKPADKQQKTQERVFGNVVVPYFEASSETPLPVNKLI